MDPTGIYYRRHLPHYQPEGETFHVVFRLAGSVPTAVVDRVRLERERFHRAIAQTESEPARLKFLRTFRRKYFERIEKILDGGSRGPYWLARPEVAEIVEEGVHYRDRKEYDLIASTIMPNHVHLVLRLLEEKKYRRPVGQTDIIRPVRRTDAQGPVSRTDCPTAKSGSIAPDLCTDCPTDEGTASPHSAPYFDYPLTNVLRKLKWNTALRANRALNRNGAFWDGESYDHVIRDGAELHRTIWYVLNNPVVAGLCKDWREWQWSYVKPGYLED